MDHVRPVDRFNANYGRCSVYDDADVQRVVDALWREFSKRDLVVDVKPIEVNGHAQRLGGAPIPQFTANEDV
jgi:hypothetical protein